MGEVYRARDTKLKRDVALKVLPEAFARDSGRMARFQREAEVLASLNHPNIAAIYGVEKALVMELVDDSGRHRCGDRSLCCRCSSGLARSVYFGCDTGRHMA
jgi:serine/threonine protein kinase